MKRVATCNLVIFVSLPRAVQQCAMKMSSRSFAERDITIDGRGDTLSPEDGAKIISDGNAVIFGA